MKLAVPRKCCMTDNLQSCWHAEEPALPSATSPSRQGAALRSTWRRVHICWHLDLKVLRAGMWENTCCCWMGSEHLTSTGLEPDCRPGGSLLSGLAKQAQTLAAQWPCVCLQWLWQEVQDQQHHKQTQEACMWQASSQEKLFQLLHVGKGPPLMRSSSIWTWRGRKRRRGLFWQAPGRGQTSSAISIENLLCCFLIILLCNIIFKFCLCFVEGNLSWILL